MKNTITTLIAMLTLMLTTHCSTADNNPNPKQEQEKEQEQKINRAYQWLLNMSKPLNQPLAKSTGLVRSYQIDKNDAEFGTMFQQFCFVYDQALALSCAIIQNDKPNAVLFANGLIKLQQTLKSKYTGGFRFFGLQENPSNANDKYFTGAHAIATYSLLLLLEKYPNIANRNHYITSINNAFNFLETLKIKTTPKQNMYAGVFIENINFDVIATEHQHDIYFMYDKAYKVLKLNKYKTLRDEVSQVLTNKLWNPKTNRFLQGYNDTRDALDTNSWLSLYLVKSKQHKKAAQALQRVDVYYQTDPKTTLWGWNAYAKAAGHPKATNNLVWLEGSFGVALAHYRQGNLEQYQNIIKNLETSQLESGSFLYTNIDDLNYQLKSAPSVASTAWYIIATKGKDIFWK